MADIPTQRAPELGPYRTWEEAGLDPDSVVELGDGTSMTLRELLDETPEGDDENER